MPRPAVPPVMRMVLSWSFLLVVVRFSSSRIWDAVGRASPGPLGDLWMAT